MKKLTYTIILSILISTAIPAFAATSISLTPVNVNVSEGERFSLTMKIDPGGALNYTTKIELEYPANLLKIESFKLNENWTPLNQPGYNLIDNNAGKLIKTGGYPGGFSSSAVFGTVTFVSKKEGKSTIKIGANSLALSAKNQDVFDKKVVKTIVTVTPLASDKLPNEIPKGYLFEHDIKRGDKNIDVAYLQLCLIRAGVFEKEVNGYFGPATRKAVALFSGAGETVGSQTREKLNKLCATALDVVPAQLFDINLEIDDASIETVSELVARVLFVSFGRVPTPVDMTFTILDKQGNEVYRDEGKDVDIVIETEGVLTKTFKDVELPDGKYSLVLNTLYNVNIADKFFADFEVKKAEQAGNLVSWLILLFILFIVTGIWYFISSRKKINNVRK